MDKIRILLVEDEGVTAMDLKSNLLQLGYEVPAVVSSGAEAVQQAAELLPDLVLMDITLHGPMSGVEAAAEINRAHHIPIIYLTAHTDSETLEQAKITEPFGYLPKPCHMNTLITTIEMALYKGEADKARRKAEAALSRVLKEQKIILDNLGYGVAFVKDRKILWSNPALARLFGYAPAEIEGRGTEMLYSDRQGYLHLGQEGYATLARDQRYSQQFQMKRKDGTLFWCRLTGQAVNPATPEEGSIWIMEDISERRQMEEALRQSEAKYRTVADFTHDWEFWIGPDEALLYCSPSCKRITGHSAAAFIKDPDLLRRVIHPDDRATFDQHRHACKTLQDDSDGLEFRIVRPDGATRWISHSCRPVFDGEGLFAGSRGSNRDITRRKQLEAEIIKARNLEALGILAGGIAHDFNNLFQGLLGNLSLAKMCTPVTSEAFQYLTNAEQVYASASKLTSQLIAFSSGGISLRTNLQPAALLQEAVNSDLEGRALVAEFDLAPDLGIVNIDPSQFRQVIHHLVENARDAMPTGGRLRVMATNVSAESPQGLPPTLTPGNYLKISIQDSGSGISLNNLPRIFDPYFSTKQRGVQKGMGLGLSLCDTIIKRHKGVITVETEPGRGSTFHIYLPAVISQPEKTTAMEVNRGPGGEGPRILLMDDDLGVLQVATKFLSLSGYQVDTVPNGDMAIKAYQEALTSATPYTAVILDLTIPGGMGGKEAIAILKKMDPQVKAFVSSGYVSDPVMIDSQAYGFIAAIEKPYRLIEIKEMLERLIKKQD